MQLKVAIRIWQVTGGASTVAATRRGLCDLLLHYV